MSSSARILLFVNLAHALVHYAMLIFPTAVITIGIELGMPYEELIPLSTGGFVAFGLLSLPAGWLADRLDRSLLLTAFFVGIGIACLMISLTTNTASFAATLLLLGSVSALYHPFGLSLLASHSGNYGRELGLHGLWGNLGAATASLVTAFLAARLGWRSAFWMPGILALALAMFIGASSAEKSSRSKEGRRHPNVASNLFAILGSASPHTSWQSSAVA